MLPIIFLYKYCLPTNPEKVQSWEVTCLCQHRKEAPAIRRLLPEAIFASKFAAVSTALSIAPEA